MYRFFFNIFRRNLVRQSTFPLINIAGLAIGLTAVMLICAFVFNEYSYDRFFANHSRIYRINSYMTRIMAGRTLNLSSNALVPVVKEEIPEVEASVRILVGQASIKVDNVPYKVERFCWADSGFFRLFDRPFVYGSSETVFTRPNTVAVSESQARILFGDRDPVGETVEFNHLPLFEISGVYRDFPPNTSLNYQMIGNYMSGPEWIRNPQWGGISLESWCLLASGADAAAVESRMQEVIKKNTGEGFFEARLQPLDRVHLHSKEYMYLQAANVKGDAGRVRMFLLLAAIVLLVACINYMNLSTARAQKRSREIGISKALGAKRRTIILRLYFETGLFTLMAFAVAFMLTILLLPAFNTLAGQDVRPEIFLTPLFLAGIFSIYLLTTLVSASYPALYLSGFSPLTVIRQASAAKGSTHERVRKVLSVVQFSIAVILIAWVMVIRLQVNYMTGKNIGYDPENVLGIIIPNVSGLEALKNNYLAETSVQSATVSQAFPFGHGSGQALFRTMADMKETENSNTVSSNSVIINANVADSDILDVFRFHLIAGSTLPERKQGDTITSVILNRNAVEFLETTPEEIIGKRIPAAVSESPVYVCGVVEDFNFNSLHEPMTPFCFHNDIRNGGLSRLLLKVKEGDMTEQLRRYEEIFKRYYPNDLFEVEFPSVHIARAYEEDRQTNRIVLSFSLLAVVVACMGVFGLTAFMAEQRTREIGIRKVLGASITSIVRLFTRSYVRLLVISLVISIPVAWWIGNEYLEGFAYRIPLSWWIFTASSAITIAVTLLTVGVVAVKAASANPVKSIKSEG